MGRVYKLHTEYFWTIVSVSKPRPSCEAWMLTTVPPECVSKQSCGTIEITHMKHREWFVFILSVTLHVYVHMEIVLVIWKTWALREGPHTEKDVERNSIHRHSSLGIEHPCSVAGAQAILKLCSPDHVTGADYDWWQTKTTNINGIFLKGFRNINLDEW